MELVFLLDLWLKFVLVMKFAQIDAVIKLGFQVGVVKSRRAGRSVVDFLVSIL
jgi:hypothetical protein